MKKPKPKVDSGVHGAPAHVIADKKLYYCDKHPGSAPMTYDPSEDALVCQVDGCTYIRRRRLSFSTMFAPGEARPAAYRGALEVRIDDEGKPWLYLVDVNGMVDLSRLIDEPTTVVGSKEGMPPDVIAAFLGEPDAVEVKIGSTTYKRPANI